MESLRPESAPGNAPGGPASSRPEPAPDPRPDARVETGASADDWTLRPQRGRRSTARTLEDHPDPYMRAAYRIARELEARLDASTPFEAGSAPAPAGLAWARLAEAAGDAVTALDALASAPIKVVCEADRTGRLDALRDVARGEETGGAAHV